MLNTYHNSLLIILSNLIFIIVRIFFLLYTIPIINNFLVNIRLKLFFSLSLGILILPSIPYTKVILLSHHGIIVILQQIIIGIIFGLIIKLILFFIIFAGEIISMQIGLYNTSFFDYLTLYNTSIFTKILNIFFLLLFFFYNGHLWILFFIVKSFYFLPLYNQFDINITIIFIKILNACYVNSLILIFPIIIILFLCNLLIGTIFRMSSYISNFIFILFYFIIMLFLFFFHSIFFNIIILLFNKIINIVYTIFF